jgi:hypothetical protein
MSTPGRSARPPAFLICLLTFWIGSVAGPCAVGAAEEVVVDGVLHQRNPATPRDGSETWNLRELWRAGGEDDDIFFGVIFAAVSDEAGNLYLLDRQLCQIFVYSPQGELLKTLSRQGEGPGETQRPIGLLFMPDGSLGIVQGFPGRIVKIDLDGNPAGTFSPGGGPAAGGFAGLSRVANRGGQLVVCGNLMTQIAGGGMQRTSYLASCGEDGAEKVRFLSLATEPDFGNPRFDEKKQYFVDRGGWALGPDGRLYTAPERDRYAIHVFRPDASLERVIERPYQPRKRTAEDIEDLKNGMVAIVNGRRVEVETHIEDHDPAVRELRVDKEGNLWVLEPQGARGLPSGVVRIYDVFDPTGTYTKQVRIACDGDAEADRLLFASDDRLLLIKGAEAALDAMFAGFGEGGGEEAEEGAPEPAPLEVVCYARGS